MLTDEQIAGSIGRRLHAAVADMQPPAGLAKTIRTRHARRRTVAYGLGAVPVLVVAAVTAVLVSMSGPHAGSVTARGPAGADRIETVSYVRQQADTALAHAGDFIVESRSGSPGLDFVWHQYTDPTNGRTRGTSYTTDGRKINDMTVSGPVTGAHEQVVTIIDYSGRSWWTTKLGLPKGAPTGTSGAGNAFIDSGVRVAGLLGAPISGGIIDPARLRAVLDAGTARIVGHDRIDDQDTVHLRFDVGAPLVKQWVDLFVDTGTYLVRRSIASPVAGAPAGVPGVTTDFHWLPRTPANLAMLDVKPPAGFTPRTRW